MPRKLFFRGLSHNLGQNSEKWLSQNILVDNIFGQPIKNILEYISKRKSWNRKRIPLESIHLGLINFLLQNWLASKHWPWSKSLPTPKNWPSSDCWLTNHIILVHISNGKNGLVKILSGIFSARIDPECLKMYFKRKSGNWKWFSLRCIYLINR